MNLQFSEICVELFKLPLAELAIFVDIVNVEHQFGLLLAQFEVRGEHFNGILFFQSHDEVVTIFVENFLSLRPVEYNEDVHIDRCDDGLECLITMKAWDVFRINNIYRGVNDILKTPPLLMHLDIPF